MNIIKKGFLVTAIAASLGFAGMVPAHADTFASSILRITNFQLQHSSGAAFSTADFDVLSGTNDAHATASVNAVFANGTASVPILAGNPNVAQQFVGFAPIGADVYTPIGGIPPVPGTFGHADQRLQGASIAINGTPAGALAETRADAGTVNNAVSSGNSDVGTSTTFSFVMGGSDTMTVDFGADAYTRAFVSADAGPFSNANARLSWSINILDITTPGAPVSVFSFAPPELNANSNVSATDAAPDDIIYNQMGLLFSATTPLLLAGNTYQITIQHNSLANALQQEVPEPATLAILAAGLLSMSLLSRRRQQ